MKRSLRYAAFFSLLLLLPIHIYARHIGLQHSHHGHHHTTQVSQDHHGANDMVSGQHRADTVRVPGSRLPDCSHACGSCSPCRLVMVSFVCASIEEAESCPMAYKCMCKNKSYPVP
ncbi:protein EPIDERMAL PATTERNING FACTOR 1-like [Rutidosis leptorrhynchoides]|uniref:protein EPIDERMAL PATTERNING FACTOR 1-like n=1 Tax=Rutidosis leptorrhynchoides TaxID=125765 RepID=UPI003A9971E4